MAPFKSTRRTNATPVGKPAGGEESAAHERAESPAFERKEEKKAKKPGSKESGRGFASLPFGRRSK